jgi:hypothetical protein
LSGRCDEIPLVNAPTRTSSGPAEARYFRPAYGDGEYEVVYEERFKYLAVHAPYFTVASFEADAKNDPSGKNATALTQSEWPCWRVISNAVLPALFFLECSLHIACRNEDSEHNPAQK